MMRTEELSEITDGRLYQASDMVKIGTSGCKGCAECCHVTEDTIKLDPWDIYHLQSGTHLTFQELLAGGYIALGVVDALVMPHIAQSAEGENGKGCRFLGPDERCTIHGFRPGFCRMFPLGRLWREDGDFSYILQVHECSRRVTKVKIRKWLEIEDLPVYEEYVRIWHSFLTEVRQTISSISSEALRSKLCTYLLGCFYAEEWETDRSFYDQFEERMVRARQMIGLSPR